MLALNLSVTREVVQLLIRLCSHYILNHLVWCLALLSYLGMCQGCYCKQRKEANLEHRSRYSLTHDTVL